MPIEKNVQIGSNEGVTFVTFGTGDIAICLGKKEINGETDQLLFIQGKESNIGSDYKWKTDHQENVVPLPDEEVLGVAFQFDKKESILVLQEQVTELVKLNFPESMDYLICKAWRNNLLRSTTEFVEYGWSDEFILKELKALKSNFSKNIKESEAFNRDYFDPNNLSKKEMLDLGFRKWDESGLLLIPFYLFPILSEGAEVIAIDGEKVKGKSNMDNEYRFGCLAFGVIP